MSETPTAPESEIGENINPLQGLDQALEKAANKLAGTTQGSPEGARELLEHSREVLREKEQEFRKRVISNIRIKKRFSLRDTSTLTYEERFNMDNTAIDAYPDTDDVINFSVLRAGRDVFFSLPIAEGPYTVLETVLHELGVDAKFPDDERGFTDDPIHSLEGSPTNIEGINANVNPPSLQVGEEPRSYDRKSSLTGQYVTQPEIVVEIDDDALHRIRSSASLPPLIATKTQAAQ